MNRLHPWQRIPVVIRAVALGMLVQVVAVMPCISLFNANLEHAPQVPWSAALSVVWVALVFQYARGRGWPASTSASRRHMTRSHALDPRLRRPVLFASVSLTVTIASLAILGYMLVSFPIEAGSTFLAVTAMPTWTAVTVMLTLAAITGVVEETAFRGYMQVPVEDRHGPVIGIGVSSMAFTLVHVPPLVILPLFLTGSVGFGMLARLAGTTRPGMVVHAVVDGAILMWILTCPEAFKDLLTRSLSSTGFNASLGMNVALAGLGLVATGIAFVRLHGLRGTPGNQQEA